MEDQRERGKGDRTNLLVKDEAHACGQETGQEVIDPPEEEKKDVVWPSDWTTNVIMTQI